MASRPASTQTISALPGVPTLHVMTRALRKTPVPMMFATLTEIAAISPRPRMSCVCSLCIRFIHRLHRCYFAICEICGLVSKVVRDQIFVSVAAPDERDRSIFTNQHRSGERSPIIVKHLGQ